MQVYLRFFWRWLSGLLPTCYDAAWFARHVPYSRGLWHELAAFQHAHWLEFTRACTRRYRAYGYHRRYEKQVRQRRARQDTEEEF